MGKLQMTEEGYNKKMEEFNRIKQKLKQTSGNKIEYFEGRNGYAISRIRN